MKIKKSPELPVWIDNFNKRFVDSSSLKYLVVNFSRFAHFVNCRKLAAFGIRKCSTSMCVSLIGLKN